MARSDLLIELVRTGASGDVDQFRQVTETIIADERAKRHDVVAARLREAIDGGGQGQLATTTPASVPKSSADIARASIAPGLMETWPTRQLEDLVLPDGLHHQLTDFIEEQLRSDELRSHGLEPVGNLLLVGPPGCGKTSIAEVIANQLALPLYTIRYDTLISSYMGETANRLAALFDLARRDRCVLFFDEVDAIGKERSDAHDVGELKRVVASLLHFLDRAPTYSPVLAATNHPELIDSAAWRRFPARFDVPLPTRALLVRYFAKWEEQHKLELGLAPSTLAKAVHGGSYADAETLANAIARRIVMAGRQPGSEPRVEGNTRVIAREQITRFRKQASG